MRTASRAQPPPVSRGTPPRFEARLRKPTRQQPRLTIDIVPGLAGQPRIVEHCNEAIEVDASRPGETVHRDIDEPFPGGWNS